MARVGQNPMRWVNEVDRPTPVTVCVVVHIPTTTGYWAESKDVLGLCLGSLANTRSMPFDLLVFDNNSCKEVRDFLLAEFDNGTLQSLFLSNSNLGKAGAWNQVFGASTGEVVAYADQDVLFLPGWLEASLEVIDAFPEAGMVTAQPARRGTAKCLSTLRGAQEATDVMIETGDLLPRESHHAYRVGLGRTEEEFASIVKGREDVAITREGGRAFVSADHFQFVMPQKVLDNLLPFDVSGPLSPEDDSKIDIGVDELGFWRLSTEQFLVHHLGNRMPREDFLKGLGLEGWSEKFRAARGSATVGGSSTSVRSPKLRKILKKINARTYSLLYGKD